MPGTGDDDDDDEIRDVGGSNQLAPNTKCPICSKELLFTVDPVQCVRPIHSPAALRSGIRPAFPPMRSAPLRELGAASPLQCVPSVLRLRNCPGYTA